jgi:pimeloyl-ACP methyl ester carboxylesterase
VVGWCTGADVALDFARRAPERVQSLVCLNGPFTGVSAARTPYQRSLERIVRRAAESEAHASLFHSLLGQLLSAPTEPPNEASENHDAMRRAISVLDPELLHITGEPLRSAASFFRYCVQLRSYFDEAPRAVPGTTLHALVVSAKDDAIAHADASREVAERLGAELLLSETGGHFAPCKDDALVARVSAFLAQGEATQGNVVPFHARGELNTGSARYLPSAPAA